MLPNYKKNDQTVFLVTEATDYTKFSSGKFRSFVLAAGQFKLVEYAAVMHDYSGPESSIVWSGKESDRIYLYPDNKVRVEDLAQAIEGRLAVAVEFYDAYNDFLLTQGTRGNADEVFSLLKKAGVQVSLEPVTAAPSEQKGLNLATFSPFRPSVVNDIMLLPAGYFIPTAIRN